MLDENYDSCVHGLLGDVVLEFIDNPRTGQKGRDDISFCASRDKEAKVGQKGIIGNFFRYKDMIPRSSLLSSSRVELPTRFNDEPIELFHGPR